MVESLPPPIGGSKRNTHISALFTPLVVLWQEQFMIGVIVASTSQKNSKKGMTMMKIDKYCLSMSLTRTLTHHCGLGMHIAIPTPFATLVYCSAGGSGWTVLFLGTQEAAAWQEAWQQPAGADKMPRCWWTC
jgi:hypothetical protein